MLKDSSKGKFQGMTFYFTKDAEFSFHQLCLAFTIALIFRHFDPLLFICVQTNVLGFAISAILSQQHLETNHWHPVTFLSRKKNSCRDELWYWQIGNGCYCKSIQAVKALCGGLYSPHCHHYQSCKPAIIFH